LKNYLKLEMRIISFSIFVFLILVMPAFVYAQLEWDLNIDSGYLLLNNNETSYGAGIDGDVKYKIKSDNRLAVFNVRAKPEIYDIDEKLLSLKFKASADYYQYNNNLSWAVKVDYSKFSYNLKGNDHYNSSVFLLGEINSDMLLGIESFVRAGYSSRSVESGFDLTMDLVFTDLMFFHRINSDLKLGYGFYLEKFIANNEFTYNYQPGISSKGLRYGPQVSFQMNSEYILRGNYNFLIHDSEETTTFSFEQQMNLVFGKNIFENTFLMLYLTYYDANLKYDAVASSLYFQSNYENTVYLKLSYDLSDITEIYLKPGYRRIKLTQLSDSFSEWHFLVGVGITK